METFSALLAICAGNSPVTGEFPTQRPVTRSFDVYFDLHQNKRSSKQSQGWWFETPSRPLWRHRNECILPLSGMACGYREIGSKPSGDRNAWSDRDLALMNGPLTALEVWHTTCGIIAYVDVSEYILHVITRRSTVIWKNSQWSCASTGKQFILYIPVQK